mmetsp:Transcript_4327/g.9354  ORF Transcript_4327/g.9354 Transcript_4327/m.9354 type:complete len:83 (+) Transcript_4327:1219-1467(+)
MTELERRAFLILQYHKRKSQSIKKNRQIMLHQRAQPTFLSSSVFSFASKGAFCLLAHKFGSHAVVPATGRTNGEHDACERVE